MMQIHEILRMAVPGLKLVSSAGAGPIEDRIKKKIIAESNRTDFFAPPRRLIRLRKWHDDHLTLAYRLHEFSKIWSRSLSSSRGIDMAIMDDPLYFLPLFRKLRRLRIPVIASCQNIETLATHQVKKKWALDFFKEELEIFSQCRLVITVSREEDVLLNNLGISSLYLPYYPGKPLKERFLAVRENRGKTGKDGFLVIGNAGNLQTRKGMETLGRYWQENQLEAVGGKLLLGGFQSNGFFTPGHFGSSVEFLGALPNDTLDSILTRVKAVICYQENGAGALTRICEMLMAGVPVLANSYAARSYYNMKGVVEYRELDELKEALKQVDKLEGEIPVPAAPDISLVSLKIQKILE